MGITNLLPFLEKSTKPCHVSQFRGRTVAIDSYCWLHKGASCCADKLARGEDTDQYVMYCMKYIKMLLSYDVQPLMVFDGRHLPAKLKTEEKRRRDRKNAKKQAIELLRLGKTDEAYRFFRQCVDVTPRMALALMKECRKLKVECIVAPYESDAQLAFFNLKGIAEVVITEDSDLLLFGCKKVLYKMDLNGSGQLVESDQIYLSMKMKPEQYTFDKFRHMCILSGCDYLNSLPGVGIKKALKFVTMTAETNPEIFLNKVPKYLNLRNATVTEEYKRNFLMADATFLHQIVFDPSKRALLPLNDLHDFRTKPEYCENAGEIFDDDKAFQLALGNLNPMTFEKIDDFQPEPLQGKLPTSNYCSIWTGYRKFSAKYTKQLQKTLNNSLESQSVQKVVMCDKSSDSSEKAANEYDAQLKKELELYKVAPLQIEEPEPAPLPESDNETSPVLGNYTRNPFLKRKISKFSLTETKNEVVVKSRFFCSQPESCTIEEETVEITDQSTTSYENSEEVTLSEDTFDVKIDKLPGPDVTMLSTLTSLENILDQPIVKKRKIEPRSFKGKIQSDKKQPTIRDMFKKMKAV